MATFSKATPMLRARDLDETVRFCVDVLGFSVDTLHPEGAPTFAVLDHGPVSICFDTVLWDADPQMTGQIMFDCSAARALHAAIADRADVLWGPEVYAYGRREFSISDPNGYALVFSKRTDDPPITEG